MGDWLTNLMGNLKRPPTWKDALARFPLPETLTPEQQALQDKAPLAPARKGMDKIWNDSPVGDFLQYGLGTKDLLLDPEDKYAGKKPSWSAAAGQALNTVNPLDKGGDVLKAVGVMPPLVRMLNKSGKLGKLKAAVGSLENVGLKGGQEEAAMNGFRESVSRLMETHPGVMTELEGVSRRNLDSPGLYDSISPSGYRTKAATRDYNTELAGLFEANPQLKGQVSDEPLGIGNLVIDPSHYITGPWADERTTNYFAKRAGSSTAVHEAAHHAQKLISDTHNRRTWGLGDTLDKFGDDVGYWLNPDEIGARATDYWKNERSRQAAPDKSYLDAVVREINKTIRSKYSVTPGWPGGPLKELDDWADKILPVLSERYGYNFTPIREWNDVVGKSVLVGVGKGSRLPSRIVKGRPVTLDIAKRLAGMGNGK